MPTVKLIRNNLGQAEYHDDNLKLKVAYLDYLSQSPELVTWRNQVGMYFRDHQALQVAEIGSALGDGVNIIAGYLPDNAQVYGLEEDIVLTGYAVYRVANPRAEFKFCNYNHLRFEDASIDGVYIEQILYDLEDPAKDLADVKRVLTGHGHLVLCEPDYNSWRFPFLSSEQEAILVKQLSARVKQPALANSLAKYLPEQGFEVQQQFSFVVTLDNYKLLKQFIDFELLMSFSGMDEEEVAAIMSEFKQAIAEQRFACSYTMNTVFATKA